MGKKALIVVDAQNDFVFGDLGTKEAQEAVWQIIDLVARVYGYGFDLLYTQDSHNGDYLKTLEGKNLPVEHCLYGSWGWRIVDGVDYRQTGNGRVRHCEKRQFGYDDWESEFLDQYEEIYICGFCTDICVISNALNIKTFYPNLPIKVVSDCCAGTTPDKHRFALEVMQSCQIRHVKSREVC